MRTSKFERNDPFAKLRPSLAIALAALVMFTSVAAWACPSEYVPCGEKKQLCCPQR